MRTILYEHYGEPSEVLQVHTVPDLPAPSTDEVLIRVLSRPVHPGDLIGIRGRYRAPGNTADVAPGGARPGFDGAGVISNIGPEVAKSGEMTVGKRVAFFPARWAWGDYVLAPAQFVTLVPDDIPDRIAAQLHVGPLTAALLIRMLDDAGVNPGDLIVLTAAASAVAKVAMTLAFRKGLSVLGLVRSNEGAVALQAEFPQSTIVSTANYNWKDSARSVTGGQPIRAVFDAVGGTVASDLITLMGDGGTFVGYGDLSGQPISFPALSLPVRGLTMKGVSIGKWAGLPQHVRAEDLRTIIDLARSSPSLFPVAAEYDLAQAKQAVIHTEQPRRAGVVLLTSLIG